MKYLGMLRDTSRRVELFLHSFAASQVKKHALREVYSVPWRHSPQHYILCDPSALYEYIVSNWCRNCGLDFKHRSYILVRKYKAALKLLLQKGIEITVSTELKYLRITVVSRLTWKQNTVERHKGSTTALYFCTPLVGIRWVLRPHICSLLTIQGGYKTSLFYGVRFLWLALGEAT